MKPDASWRAVGVLVAAPHPPAARSLGLEDKRQIGHKKAQKAQKKTEDKMQKSFIRRLRRWTQIIKTEARKNADNRDMFGDLINQYFICF